MQESMGKWLGRLGRRDLALVVIGAAVSAVVTKALDLLI